MANDGRFMGRAIIAAMTVLIAAALPLEGAQAQERRVPGGRGEVKLSFAPVVKAARPAVVNVYVRSRVKQSVSPFFNDPFFRRFFGREFGIPRERVESSLGSGVIVSADGLVITNDHVLKGGSATEIKVALADKRQFDARVLLRDKKTDLAVLQIEGDGGAFPFLEFADSDRLEVGDLVLAIGNPFGVGQTVTSGIVSALARTRVGEGDAQFFIQTDAAINPGNSGGALVDLDGRLVGINTAIFSRSGGSHGIGYAIPSNLVRLVASSAQNGGEVERPWFGAELSAVNADVAEALGLERVSGALVQQVYPDSPAQQAGLRHGDVIVSVDGQSVGDPRAFNYRFTTRGVGGTAEVTVVRGDRERTFDVALLRAPGSDNVRTRRLEGRHPLEGAEVADVSPAIAEDLGLRTREGVVVLDIARDSTAAGFGFRPGDVVARINRRPIDSVARLERLLSARPRQWRIAVRRKGRILRLVVPGQL